MRKQALDNLIRWAEENPRHWWVLTQSRRFKALRNMLEEVMKSGSLPENRSNTLWRLADVVESQQRWENARVPLPSEGAMISENVTITSCRRDEGTGNVRVMFFSMKGWKGEFSLIRENEIRLVMDRWTDLFTIRGRVLRVEDYYLALKVEELSPVTGGL